MYQNAEMWWHTSFQQLISLGFFFLLTISGVHPQLLMCKTTLQECLGCWMHHCCIWYKDVMFYPTAPLSGSIAVSPEGEEITTSQTFASFWLYLFKYCHLPDFFFFSNCDKKKEKKSPFLLIPGNEPFRITTFKYLNTFKYETISHSNSTK